MPQAFATMTPKDLVRGTAPKETEESFMALTRKFLTALGIEADKADEIISAHTESVEALKAQRDEYKTKYDEIKDDAGKASDLQKQLDDLKKDSYKVKYEALKEEYTKYKADQEATATKSAKESAYKALLKDLGISEKRLDAILKVTDLGKIELDSDGKIKDADKLKTDAKTEWEDFIVTKETKGAATATPPQNTGGKMNRDEILKIKDTSERQKAIAENHDLFGI